MVNNKFVWLTVCLVVTGLITVFALTQGPWRDQPIANSGNQPPGEVDGEGGTVSAAAKPLSEVLGVGEEDLVLVGGVERPRKSVEFAEPQEVDFGDRSPLPLSGLPRSVAADSNPSVESLFADLKDPEKRAEASFSYVSLEPFDLESYQEDPEAYLRQVRPARVNQTAQPGEGVVPLKAESKLFTQIALGESVVLRARGTPGMPIVFHTNQYGTFENELKTISLAFDEEGLATAMLKTGSGTEPGLMSVLAASPMHSGRLKYVVQVVSVAN